MLECLLGQSYTRAKYGIGNCLRKCSRNNDIFMECLITKVMFHKRYQNIKQGIRGANIVKLRNNRA